MKNKLLQKIIIRLMLITSTIYILWRLAFTLPIHFGVSSYIVGVIFIAIELIDFFEFIIHYINVLKIDESKIRHKKDFKYFPDIDVFIATINEDERLLEKNIKACLELNYQDKSKVHIYVCDDGNRDNIKQLACKYNVGYITREDNTHAKAGNYNNAISCTSSPYIAIFDADMCPHKDFLEDIIPYFTKEEKVGFVQTPQAFYNLDIYQNRFEVGTCIPFDQNFFYHGLQNTKSINNTTVLCGTNAIISREAIEKIGGFATKSITEDIATGMLIENAGYKGIYVDRILAEGYSTNAINSFIKQRKRWAFGCIQMGRSYPIGKQKGLNLKQKLEYLSCVLYWFFGIKTLLYFIAPALFSMFNIVIIEADILMFLVLWLPQYLLKRFMLDRIYNKKRSSTWNKIYETILSPALFLGTIKELFGIKKMKFAVSEKNNKLKQKNTVGICLFICHLIFLILNILSYAFSLINGHILPFLFSIANIVYILLAIIFDLNNKTRARENTEKNNISSKYLTKAIFMIFKPSSNN